jgi:hypothetical protein
MATSDNITIVSNFVYLIHALFWISEVRSGVSTNEKDVKQNLSQQLVDYSKLFFSVFSVLQKLGADDRPEVCLLCMTIHGLLNMFWVAHWWFCAIIHILWHVQHTRIYAKFLFISRFGTQQFGLSFRLSAPMGKNFLQLCGRIACGYMFSQC